MLYFNTLPKVLKTDEQGNALLMTNLMARASVIASLMKNPLVYYQYDVQEGDTPEIIAYKYYGDSYRYWVILYINSIIDPQWQWPMSNDVFEKYLQEKYPSVNTKATVAYYEQIQTTTDLTTNDVTIEKVKISQTTYNTLVPSKNTYTLPSGALVNIDINKAAVTIYDYELDMNESKRNIKILKSTYVDEMEKQLTSLMKQ